MPFVLGARSRERLQGVHPDLVTLVERAIGITSVDFTVIEGLRSTARQTALVAAGASQTMNSRHLDGHAVDLAPFIAGEVRWDWPPFYRIADAMRRSALGTGIPVTWGGAWGRMLNHYGSARLASETYLEEKRAAGDDPWLDGAHFELPWAQYPS